MGSSAPSSPGPGSASKSPSPVRKQVVLARAAFGRGAAGGGAGGPRLGRARLGAIPDASAVLRAALGVPGGSSGAGGDDAGESGRRSSAATQAALQALAAVGLSDVSAPASGTWLDLPQRAALPPVRRGAPGRRRFQGPARPPRARRSAGRAAVFSPWGIKIWGDAGGCGRGHGRDRMPTLREALLTSACTRGVRALVAPFRRSQRAPARGHALDAGRRPALSPPRSPRPGSRASSGNSSSSNRRSRPRSSRSSPPRRLPSLPPPLPPPSPLRPRSPPRTPLQRASSFPRILGPAVTACPPVTARRGRLTTATRALQAATSWTTGWARAVPSRPWGRRRTWSDVRISQAPIASQLSSIHCGYSLLYSPRETMTGSVRPEHIPYRSLSPPTAESTRCGCGCGRWRPRTARRPRGPTRRLQRRPHRPDP